jgi:hypothetical protein
MFRREVSCATLLERWQAGWRLDRRDSTRRALKYRRGKGEVLIINHDGHGWWDPQSPAKGDVIDLVKYLDPSLNFGELRRALRRLLGVAPPFPEALPLHIPAGLIARLLSAGGGGRGCDPDHRLGRTWLKSANFPLRF